MTGDNSDSDREEQARDKRNGLFGSSMDLDSVPPSAAADSVTAGQSIYPINRENLTCYTGQQTQHLIKSGKDAFILEVDDMYKSSSMEFRRKQDPRDNELLTYPQLFKKDCWTGTPTQTVRNFWKESMNDIEDEMELHSPRDGAILPSQDSGADGGRGRARGVPRTSQKKPHPQPEWPTGTPAFVPLGYHCRYPASIEPHKAHNALRREVEKTREVG